MEWSEKNVILRENRVAVKLSHNNGAFMKSILLPTEYYPLNGEYKVFSSQNTKRVEDPDILAAFNRVKYQIGHCYQNADNLVTELARNGINAKPYVGWLFIGCNQTPIHHCWVMVGDSLLDLSDDATAMNNFVGVDRNANISTKEGTDAILRFTKAAKSMDNTTRCAPVGVPTDYFLYIGSECTPQKGRQIYNNLMQRFPHHECEKSCDNARRSPMQRLLYENGLMA